MTLSKGVRLVGFHCKDNIESRMQFSINTVKGCACRLISLQAHPLTRSHHFIIYALRLKAVVNRFLFDALYIEQLFKKGVFLLDNKIILFVAFHRNIENNSSEDERGVPSSTNFLNRMHKKRFGILIETSPKKNIKMIKSKISLKLPSQR